MGPPIRSSPPLVTDIQATSLTVSWALTPSDDADGGLGGAAGEEPIGAAGAAAGGDDGGSYRCEEAAAQGCDAQDATASLPTIVHYDIEAAVADPADATDPRDAEFVTLYTGLEASSLRLASLDPGTEYLFRVRAVFRGGPSAPVPGGTAVAPRAQPKTKEEKAAQRAADANVDASLQQYMAQREAKKAAAGGGRKPVSDRLKKLRERAG